VWTSHGAIHWKSKFYKILSFSNFLQKPGIISNKVCLGSLQCCHLKKIFLTEVRGTCRKQFRLFWLPRAVDFKVSCSQIPRRAFAGIRTHGHLVESDVLTLHDAVIWEWCPLGYSNTSGNVDRYEVGEKGSKYCHGISIVLVVLRVRNPFPPGNPCDAWN
jgi:hypothetical protein